jgi:NADH-quinone oxidoreductase subunit C
VTSSPSETNGNDAEAQTEIAEPHPLQGFADRVAEAVGGTAEIQFDTVKVRVDPDTWVETHRIARDELDLVFFSWLSAVEWSNDVASGDNLSEPVEERIELLCALSNVTTGELVIMSADLSPESPTVASLVDVYAGANWHEREAHEMFGIEFEGHPNLVHLYLPDSFVGNPLRKSFPLLSREVKPWPGTVDVEPMPGTGGNDEPTTENPEA